MNTFYALIKADSIVANENRTNTFMLTTEYCSLGLYQGYGRPHA